MNMSKFFQVKLINNMSGNTCKENTSVYRKVEDLLICHVFFFGDRRFHQSVYLYTLAPRVRNFITYLPPGVEV